jgi:nitrate reductase assembly molybdenum cofactor insertion protein NarJ
MTATTLDAQAQRLIGEAAEWRLLSLLFECPSAAWRDRVTALGAEVTDEKLRAAARLAGEEASEGRYHSMFGPGGPAPAREVTYHDHVQFGYLVSELASYYEAFAYRPAIPEPADHIAVETGFVAYLLLKQAYARASGDEVHCEITSGAATQFIGSHLSAIAEPLAAALEHSGIRYLALAGQALLSRAGPRPKNAFEILDTSRATEGNAFDCGEM